MRGDAQFTAPGAPAAHAAPPSPAPGSVRYFVLLYTPAQERTSLTTLLAIADELSAGLVRGLDHGLAHLRLQWWEEELHRFNQGTSRHPWLIGWSQTEVAQARPNLRALMQAASVDLATHRLALPRERQLAAALFIAAAQLLRVASPPMSEDPFSPESALAARLGQLGRSAATLEAAAVGEAAAGREADAVLEELRELQRGGPLIEPAWQRSLAPLLLWLALAAHRWRRTRRALAKSGTMPPMAPPGRFDALADNFLAWRYARRAMRRRFGMNIE